ARKTWRYFEEFVSAADNWLPPDNVQQESEQVIASRTSPTNIGMALNADLAAYDFGYCSAARLLQRTQRTFASLARLERYRGHFFNWYDTRTLQPLHPRYVSMVDSGNLIGNLLVLSGGCIELCEQSILAPRAFAGLRDTLRVMQELSSGSSSPRGVTEVQRRIERQIAELSQAPTTLRAAHTFLSRLTTAAAELAAAV